MGGLTDLVREYLGNGGFFNPELMDHEKVRDMVIQLRDEIERLTNEVNAAIPHNQQRRAEMNQLQADNERLRAERNHYRDKYMDSSKNIEKLEGTLSSIYNEWWSVFKGTDDE